MKNRVEQIFRANEFRADDHDPQKSIRVKFGLLLFYLRYFQDVKIGNENYN
jgi:hypothetical protein